MRVENEYMLLGVNLIDGTGTSLQKNMAVTVADGMIAAVESMATANMDRLIQKIELHGRYLLPGLIDAHVHIPGVRADQREQEIGGMLEHKLVKAMRSVADARKFLKRGFTSVRDISWNGLYLKRIFQEGSLNGQRIVACGPGLGRTGGHVDLYQLPYEFVRDNHFWSILCDGPEEIRKGVRQVLREGADQIKIWGSGGGNFEIDRNSDTHYSLEEVEMAVSEAKMIEGTMVCVHCENLESVRIAVAAGADTIEHGECLDEEVAEEMAAKGIILVPTLRLLLYWFDEIMNLSAFPQPFVRTESFFQRTIQLPDNHYEETKEKIIANFQIARSKGVKVALGSDTIFEPVTPYGDYSCRELKTLVECGMTPMEALTAATKTASEALGLSHKLGTIEVGKLADYVVLTKDPSDDIDVLMDERNIVWVAMNGRIVVQDGVVL